MHSIATHTMPYYQKSIRLQYGKNITLHVTTWKLHRNTLDCSTVQHTLHDIKEHNMSIQYIRSHCDIIFMNKIRPLQRNAERHAPLFRNDPCRVVRNLESGRSLSCHPMFRVRFRRSTPSPSLRSHVPTPTIV